MLTGETTNTNSIVFGLTRSWFDGTNEKPGKAMVFNEKNK